MDTYSMIKKLLFGWGLMIVGSSFGMELTKSRPRSATAPGKLIGTHFNARKLQKVLFPVEQTHLYRLVTAERLDHQALLGYRVRSSWFNERDRYGCTPLHHLIVHPDATVDLVKHFILYHGARYDIKEKDGDMPYYYGLIYDDNVPGESDDDAFSDDVKETLAFCLKKLASRSKLLNFIHSEMIADKLWEHARQESLMRSRLKKTTFYEIT